MFDMFGDMEQKQKELQKKLAEIIIEHASDDGLISVKVDANKAIRDLSVDASLLSAENKEMLEDMLLVVFNEAIGKADIRAMEEMQNMLGDFLPDFKGLDSPFTA